MRVVSLGSGRFCVFKEFKVFRTDIGAPWFAVLSGLDIVALPGAGGGAEEEVELLMVKHKTKIYTFGKESIEDVI
ncbi:hypothetical protein E2562_038880 [Oryza meyeriana var. granulata]|uniref:Uncharacterized protein n=1 Tax=Oryza meyeriana var. granulata TaxID=110450 RepID=A0A6G1CMH8_9ORYZ|nr:hypothetical protein E2562_038880 [Oryza meyeriana var. granulata]